MGKSYEYVDEEYCWITTQQTQDIGKYRDEKNGTFNRYLGKIGWAKIVNGVKTYCRSLRNNNIIQLRGY